MQQDRIAGFAKRHGEIGRGLQDLRERLRLRRRSVRICHGGDPGDADEAERLRVRPGTADQLRIQLGTERAAKIRR
jgi:hypothetical protein